MGFRGQYKNRRDGNETEIVRTFEAHGFSVYSLDQPVDLLVGYMGLNYLIEVKMPKGTTTKPQEKFFREWKGSANIIRSTEEAQTFIYLVKKSEEHEK